MQPRIAQQDLQTRPGGRVPGLEGVYILLKPLEKHGSFDIFWVLARRAISALGPRPPKRLQVYKMPTNAIKNFRDGAGIAVPAVQPGQSGLWIVQRYDVWTGCRK